MPSVLIETGFLTNKRGSIPKFKKGQKEMSSSIKGILNYKTKFNNVQPIGPLNSFQQNDNREKIDDYYLKIQLHLVKIEFL